MIKSAFYMLGVKLALADAALPAEALATILQSEALSADAHKPKKRDLQATDTDNAYGSSVTQNYGYDLLGRLGIDAHEPIDTAI